MAFHTTHQKGYQCKLLVVHSKGGRCNFWGFLDCDDRRLKWWASHNGPQYDRSRSDTVMIKMNFNSYASLAIFFIIAVLFCFVFKYETVCTMREFSCVWFLLSYLSLLSDRAWKPSKSDCPLVFSLRNFRLCLRIIRLITALDMFINICLLFLLLLAFSLVTKFHFQLTKSLKEVLKKVKHITIWRMAWQL